MTFICEDKSERCLQKVRLMKGILPCYNIYLTPGTSKIMTVTILQLQQNGNQPGPGFGSGKEMKHFVPLILLHETRGMNHERVLQNVKM